ncbi:hypothetical protein MON38_21500 [Hymenobacter sp. DH14]|uniref:Uncharacterized protein n=1 Tax=Hymenobacter cyanobacteriorum TaxID=2926463 RepID=A0A9X1VKT8_9BACT|nr:hypothetical protein [Hymenobacter cyanobacteriorum]MCI1190007.1 hypothetical protein [Hymenobacter cyanobacteriorum]
MPELFALPASQRLRFFFWLQLLLLLTVLLLLGIYSEQITIWLIAAWPKLLGAAGLNQLAQHLQQGLDGGIAKRPLPAVATYAALYLLTCLLLLRLVLSAAQWRVALRIYALGLVLYVLITILAKLAGNVQWAYRLSRRLLDFIVSPLPVAGLYVLLRSGFGPAAVRDRDAGPVE